MTIGKLCPTCGGANCARHPRRHANQRGYDATWSRFAARYLEVRPFCEHEEGCRARARHVHHLDGLGPTGPRGYDPENLQPLCNSHHSVVTAATIKAEANTR